MKTNKTTKNETENAIVYEGDLILTKDFKTCKHLIVKGNISGKDGTRYNINAWDINAWDINALNINALNINARNINARNIDARNIDAWAIDARNIVCERRIKKSKTVKTISRVFIQEKSKIKRKEQKGEGK